MENKYTICKISFQWHGVKKKKAINSNQTKHTDSPKACSTP